LKAPVGLDEPGAGLVAATANVLLIRQYDALRDRHQRIAAAHLHTAHELARRARW
jgi:hypothetical protein